MRYTIKCHCGSTHTWELNVLEKGLVEERYADPPESLDQAYGRVLIALSDLVKRVWEKGRNETPTRT